MRLIDADALIAEYDRVHVGAPGNARKLIEDAPTIEPSAQPEVMSVAQTIKGYSIDQLILIANVLERENLPPERVAEALTDMQRAIAMAQSEFEESLRQSVKWFMEDDLK